MLDLKNVGHSLAGESWLQGMARHLYQGDKKIVNYRSVLLSENLDAIEKIAKEMNLITVLEQHQSHVYLGQEGIINCQYIDRVDKNGLYYNIIFDRVGSPFFEKQFIKIFDTLEEYTPEFPEPEIEAGFVNVLSKNEFGALYFRTIDKPASSELLRENYSKKVLDGYDYIVKEISKPNPSGRICILQGDPGTGKTYMIRAMLQEFKNNQVVLISPDMIDSLNDPSLTELLFDQAESGFPFIFLIEDADYCLAPREDKNENVISKVLNMADGIMGSLLDVRIIATTNVKINTFDDAIVRPGRLLKLVNIDPLPFDRSIKRYEQLGGKAIHYLEHKEYTIAEIYKLVYDERIQEELNND